MSTKSLSRRTIIKATAGLSALAAFGIVGKRLVLEKLESKNFAGKILGPNFKRGHHLFLKDLPLMNQPKKVKKKVKVCIVGTGVSGLSSAYHLHRLRPDLTKDDVVIYELENHNGGNAHAYQGRAPWGAHYLPLPNPENSELISFLKKIKVASDDQRGDLLFDPYMIAGAPRERLFIYGRFQEGLVPNQNISHEERDEIKKFFNLTKKLTHQRGRDGKYLFDIPMERSSKDEEWINLDKISFKDYLIQEGLKGAPLHWYANYCCRDDYGTTIQEISAWAGLHYFCSRRPKKVPGYEEEGSELVLTWPEGNNFLVKKLIDHIPYTIHNECLLTGIEDKVLSLVDFKNSQQIEVEAEQIILALPQFILKHLKKEVPSTSKFEYTPWMVANLHLKWDEALSKELAWDNVNYHGKGLGFITSHHQSLKSNHQESILTYYLPLTEQSPLKARRYAMGRTHAQWTEDILSDLEPMIFDIRERLTKVDIWPWGHAMISPKVDFLFKERLNPLNFGKKIHLAHSDLSGLSLFEEAFYQGHNAAKKVAGELS